jgi:hypothetical protein
MWYKEDNFTVKIGSNFYKNTPNLIVYKGESIFTITRAESTELLGINFIIYDEKGNKIAVVKQGRIYSGDKNAYEIIVNQNEYILKEQVSGRIICDIKKRTLVNNAELDINVNLYTRDGFLIEATSESTNIGNNMITGSYFENCGAGIVIE